MWDLGSPTREWNPHSTLEGEVLATGPPEKSLVLLSLRNYKGFRSLCLESETSANMYISYYLTLTLIGYDYTPLVYDYYSLMIIQ